MSETQDPRGWIKENCWVSTFDEMRETPGDTPECFEVDLEVVLSEDALKALDMQAEQHDARTQTVVGVLRKTSEFLSALTALPPDYCEVCDSLIRDIEALGVKL